MNRVRNALAWATVTLPLCHAGLAGEAVIYQFNSRHTAYAPTSPLIADADGNLYGTTSRDGAGTVFELSPPGPGGTAWKQTDLHDFQSVSGFFYGQRLATNAAHNLYGVNEDTGYVYELSPPATKGAAWSYKDIYQTWPSGGVIWFQGHLYGVGGGAGGGLGYGLVYQLTPPTAGSGWTQTVLYEFQGGADGLVPSGPLAVDGHGNLFGIAAGGSGHDCGLVYELSPPASGATWTKVTLHSFLDNRNGCGPTSGIVRVGPTLYGTTVEGGVPKGGSQHVGYGTVYELQPMAGGGYRHRVIYRFSGTDGSGPYGGLLSGGRGVLFGTTYAGGANAHGVVFQLTHPAAGQPWAFTSLHDFAGSPDGSQPFGGVTFGLGGALYGTTENGGNADFAGDGTVFQISHP